MSNFGWFLVWYGAALVVVCGLFGFAWYRLLDRSRNKGGE